MKRIYIIKDLSVHPFGKELKQIANKLQKQINEDIKITITIKGKIWEYIQKKNRQKGK